MKYDLGEWKKAIAERPHLTWAQLKSMAGDVSKAGNKPQWHEALMVLKPTALKEEYRNDRSLIVAIDVDNKCFGSYAGYSLFGHSIDDVENSPLSVYRYENLIGQADFFVVMG